MIFDLSDSKPDLRRSGKEIVERILNNVENQLQLHPIRVFVLALVAGGLLCYGAAVGVRLSVGLNSAGAEHFMVTFGFLAGFTVVSLSGAALNSVANVEYAVALLHVINSEYSADVLRRIALFWLVINVGNLIGALGTAGLLVYVQIFNDDDERRLDDILRDKLKNADDGVSGIFIVVVSAMLANWIVGHCVINASSSRAVIGRVAGIFYCVFMFSVLGLQHGAATNGQIFLGLMSKVEAVSWGRAFWGNILPVIVGNAAGALVFVGWPFWYAYYFTRLPCNSWRRKYEVQIPPRSSDNTAPLA